MSGAIMAIHAAQAQKRRTAVLDAFRLRGATSQDRARPLSELGLAADDAALAELLQKGVIRALDSRGRPAVLGDAMARIEGFYLDEATFIADREASGFSRSDRVAVAVIVAIALAFVGTVLMMKLARG